MNYNRSHTYCVKDTDIFMLRNINEGSNKKIRIAKNPKSFDCSACFNECDLCFYDIGTSNSSCDEQDFSKDHLKKQNKLHKSGCVDKIPLRKEFVKSSPCLEYNKAVIEGTDDPRIHKKKILKYKSKRIEDDIDFIPVKLISSEITFPFKTNEKMKMNSARQNLLPRRSPERRISSWGKILKDQNVPTKELKRNTMAVTQNVKQKNMTTKNQPQVQTKPKTIIYDNTSQQIRLTKPIPKDSYPVLKKKSSHHTMKFEPPQRAEYSSSSGTSITGESVMLVDRSAQYSATNLDGLEPHNWCNNLNDVNQAGDSGIAFFNPVRTLNFLVRELRGKLSEGSEDDNMSRIIRDMENTIARLSKSPQGTGNIKDNWNTIINEEDLKSVLELLQNTPAYFNKVSETELQTAEVQKKLEGTCSKLEELCKQMEKTTCHKLREDKQHLSSQLKLKTEELEEAISKQNQQEQIINELKKKNEEQSKQIVSLREHQSKAAALNAILNEQLQDTEKKYQQVVTEMQFLLLEKEKNLVLMKCKDQDIQDMRKNLDEIKSLVVQHLSSFQLESTNSGTALGKENKLDFDNMTLLSTLSTTVLHRNMEEIKDQLPVCSSPIETLSPSPEDDDSWRKISNVPITAPDTPTQFDQPPILAQLDQIPLDQRTSKTICIKESLKNLFEEMKKQTKLGKNLSIQNLINLEECGTNNWNELDFSDDEIRSMTGFVISESETSK